MRRHLAVLAVLLLAACATPAEQLGTGRPRQTISSAEDHRFPIEVPDPLEGMNRGTYALNAALDTYVLLPVVRAYRFVLPDFAEERISNFFLNLAEIRNAANGLLQLRPEVASRAIIRFGVNTSFGLLGTFDVAGALGAGRQDEDFGQTLGWWGIPPGPYLVLPLLGPSSLRDTIGFATDTAATIYLPPSADINELVYRNDSVLALRLVDERNGNPFRYYETGSPFEYDIIRFVYAKRRELEIAK